MLENNNQLLWLDLETSGLEPEKDEIMEIAALITQGPDFKVINELEIQVKPSAAAISRLQSQVFYDWSSGQRRDSGQTVYDIHKQNGLIERIETSGVALDKAQQLLIAFIKQHFRTAAYLAGNSIRFDRAFIDAHLPQVAELLHYRILDVTSFKLVMSLMGIDLYQKKGSHRAMDDVKESIAELKHYLELSDFLAQRQR